MRYRCPTWAGVVAGLTVGGSVLAHPGGLDDNGGHVNRATGAYHCHAVGCIEPTIVAPSNAISVVSFNIQFLGNSPTRDDVALAALMAPYDIVVVQELVSPPFPGSFPNGDPFNPDPQSAEFFDAMAVHGFEFVLSPEDTGTGDNIHINGSTTEWWVAFFRPDSVQPVDSLPNGFLADDRSNHDDYERVPYAFAFRTTDDLLDFVLISVHLKPSAGSANEARRAHELASIAEWIDDEDDNGERDFIILGDMNIENCGELVRITPPDFASLNSECLSTNTNVNGPKPYDHVMYRSADTTESEMPRAMGVLDLIERMQVPWFLLNDGPYPGDPYNHDAFRASYSDHHPIVFRLNSGTDDD
jgi:hypothetical protein